MSLHSTSWTIMGNLLTAAPLDDRMVLRTTAGATDERKNEMPQLITRSVKATEVRKGDFVVLDSRRYTGSQRQTLVVDAEDYSVAVAAKIKLGTKKVEIRDEAEKLIFYVDRDQSIGVVREELTEEERETQKRAHYNEMIAHYVEGHDLDWIAAQAKFAEEVKGGYDAERYSFVYSALMYAHATHALKVELVQLHDGVRNRQSRDHEPLSDWVDIWAMFREDKIEKLVDYGFRGNSRSTSQVSNILEDIQHEVTANAVRRVEYPY